MPRPPSPQADAARRSIRLAKALFLTATPSPVRVAVHADDQDQRPRAVS